MGLQPRARRCQAHQSDSFVTRHDDGRISVYSQPEGLPGAMATMVIELSGRTNVYVRKVCTPPAPHLRPNASPGHSGACLVLGASSHACKRLSGEQLSG